MNKNRSINNKLGRPRGSGIYDRRLPEIRVTSQQLNSYQVAARATGQSLSSWIRNRLDIDNAIEYK